MSSSQFRYRPNGKNWTTLEYRLRASHDELGDMKTVKKKIRESG